jgi:hypothetical protein
MGWDKGLAKREIRMTKERQAKEVYRRDAKGGRKTRHATADVADGCRFKRREF